MLGNPAGPGGAVQRAGLWPLAPAPAPTPAGANFSADGFGKYGLYSLLPGASAFGNATYSHCSIGRLTTGAAAASIQPSSATAFHATHKDSLFASGYTLGAPTPPPGSPYSPVPVTQLEFLTKGFNSNIIIQQPPDFTPSPTKKHQIQIQEVPTKTTSTTPYAVDAIAKCCGRSVKLCGCHLHVKTTTMLGGCSRTNPLEWSPVSVKKEPPATPCQVAEITTSGETPLVKLEIASPNNGNINKEAIIAPPIVTTNGNIPVGIAVARQRIQHSEVVSSPSLPPAGLLTTVNTTHIKEVARISEIDAAGMAAATGGVPTTGGTLLHCPDERAFPGWPMGGAHTGSALAAPTLWQYPVSPMPVEPLVPMSMPMPPVGFQLVRDPNTGGLLLLPPAEQLQQTVLWPSYHPQSSHVLLPPFHPPPLHLLSSASSDYLQTSTTLHQHTQTHSTRLLAVTTDTTKRKIPMPIPTTTLIKIETDDQSKTLQAVSTIAANTPTTVYTDQNIAPLVTTHVIYQHPTNLILSSQTQETTSCRSQATSPVACLTPPPEINPEEETTVQDASNQTDAPIEETASIPEKTSIVPTEQQEPEIHEFKLEDNQIQEAIPEEQPDLSGLQLLSNSIEEFEKLEVTQAPVPVQSSETVQSMPAQCEVVQGIAQMTLKDKEKEDLGGLDILCALAEQRILECERAERKKRNSKKHDDEPKSKKPKPSCSCSPDPSRKDDQYKTYKTKESEEEVKRFLASKSQPLCCKGDWPFMNAMELEMRMRLADLQRKYREKQRELSKLKPKKSSSSNNNNINTTATNVNSNPSATVATSNEKKRARKKSTTPPPPHLDKIDPIKPNTKTSHELLKPPTLCPYETNPKSSPSKKRKVGRPKKLLTISGSPTLTETIFAKKPKKGSLVGYVLAAKEKLMHSSTLLRSDSPPRFVDNDVKTKTKKIRPKLKAEVKVQSEDEEQEEDVEYDEFDEEITPITQSKKIDSDGSNSFKDLENNNVIEERKEEVVEQNDKAVVKQEVHIEEVQEAVCEEEDEDEDKNTDTRCTLTTELLAKDKLRVLTAMGGLFYAGKLHAVQPPDVYSITLDGERGNKPHIMSREEILRDAIVEVSPTSTSELTAGTRLCAYWSQQYRCLYPGSVAEPELDADPSLDSRFVSVEFDDGDSGRIALEDIRLLPPDYPIIEYDPNPLLSLSKRRRRTSTTDDRRSVQSITPIPEAKAPAQTVIDATAERHREKKRMKKRKREKMLLREDKKRRKKHKCTDDNCKHRKHHKKRRKHKRHHHKESSHHAPVVEEQEEEEEEQETIAQEVAAVEEEEEVEAEAEEDTSTQFANPDDEVTMDDILEAAQNQQQNKKIRDRQESCESRSKMSAFLPAKQLWGWSGKGYKRPKGKGRSRKQFFKAIQRGKEAIVVGDSAVFLSTGRPDRPYIGRIEAMWESCGTMVVKVKWFYHPEETIGCPLNLKYPGALFESPHVDENDVQTISHKCEVLPLKEYTTKLGDDPRGYETIYDNNDIYYLAGNYDPTTTTLKMEPEIPFN